MKLSEADIIKLENYWAGQLEVAEQMELEKRLAEDLDFQTAATEWELLVKEGFMPTEKEAEEAETIKKRLLTYAKTAAPNPAQAKVVKSNNFQQNRMLYIGLAAAATLAITLWLNPLESFLKNDPYNEYFTHLSRDNANLSSEVEDGKKAYDERNYRVAYPALLAEVAAGGDSLNLIYASVAAIGSEQAEKAIPVLESLAKDKSWALYHTEIQWYLALAYLEEGEKVKAILLLETIAETGEAYREEAKALLEVIGTN